MIVKIQLSTVMVLPDRNVSSILFCANSNFNLFCPDSFSTQVLFSTSEECCTKMVPWVATEACVAESIPLAFTGTDKWYVSYYPDTKCVQDCPNENSSTCGGVVLESHQELFENPSSCCTEKLFWVPLEDCLFDSDAS